MRRVLQVPAEADGERLDKFLTYRCEGLSRSRLQRLITGGWVTVNGSPAKRAARLLAGQVVTLEMPEPVPAHLSPQDIPLGVVYQDRDILVVDKPAGLVVHPGPGHPDRTLVNAVLALCPDLQGIGGTIRPGIVHRLDKDTSGLLVIAKSDQAHARLADQLKERAFNKLYLALVHGHLSPGEAMIDAPIGRDSRNRKRMAVVDGGREAATRYKTVKRYVGYTLAEAQPVTGRTHQIRVHFASMGHPIAGDSTYGKPHSALDRHFLHANRLGLRHPSTGRYVEFESELAGDLRSFLTGLETEAA